MILKTKKEYRRGRGIMGFQFYLKYVQYTLVVAPNRAQEIPPMTSIQIEWIIFVVWFSSTLIKLQGV